MVLSIWTIDYCLIHAVNHEFWHCGLFDDMQDSSSAEDNEPLHDDSYAAELAQLRERSLARIATARES